MFSGVDEKWCSSVPSPDKAMVVSQRPGYNLASQDVPEISLSYVCKTRVPSRKLSVIRIGLVWPSWSYTVC